MRSILEDAHTFSQESRSSCSQFNRIAVSQKYWDYSYGNTPTTRRSKGSQCEVGHVKWEKDSSKSCQAFQTGQKKWKAFLCFVCKTHTQICIYVFLFHTHSESRHWVWYTQTIVWRLWERLVCLSRGRGRISEWLCVDARMDVTAHRFHWWAGTGTRTKQAVHSNASVLLSRSDRGVYGSPPEENLFLYLAH